MDEDYEPHRCYIMYDDPNYLKKEGMMRVDIDIRVQLPQITADQHLDFIDGVMKVFRKTFPNAEPLPKTSIDVPSPVTVTVHMEEGEYDPLKNKSAHAPD